MLGSSRSATHGAVRTLTGARRAWGWLAGGSSAIFIEAQNPAAKASSVVVRTLSYGWIYIRNLGNLVVPLELCPDWTGGAIPNVESFECVPSRRDAPVWSQFTIRGQLSTPHSRSAG